MSVLALLLPLEIKTVIMRSGLAGEGGRERGGRPSSLNSARANKFVAMRASAPAASFVTPKHPA